jgi:hypothetical protein
VSAVPEAFMHPHPEIRLQVPRRPARERSDADTAVQKFWQWFAVAALLFCWIAEATMCAERGF